MFYVIPKMFTWCTVFVGIIRLISIVKAIEIYFCDSKKLCFDLSRAFLFVINL